MELTFLDSALLWGALAAAVPVFVHLLMRRPPTRILFPPLRFLKAGVRAAASGRRVKRWLLLAARAALPALLAFLLAGPLLAPAKSGPENPPAVALLLDNSPSMIFRTPDGTLLDRARDAAEAVISYSPPGSLFAVASVRGTHDFVKDPKAAMELAEGELSSTSAGSLAGPLNSLFELFRVLPPDTPVSLFVFSDFARSAFEGLERSAVPKNVSVFLVDLGGKARRDRAILSVVPLSPVAAKGLPLSLEVRLSATAKLRSQVVELLVEGSRVLSRKVDLEPGRTVAVPFEFVPEKAADFVTGEVRFPTHDAFPLNDAAWFVVPRRPSATAAVLFAEGDETSAETARLVADALAPPALGDAAPYRVLLRPAAAFEASDADACCAVFLTSSELPAGNFLPRWVRRGGALFLFAAPSLDVSSLPRWTGLNRLHAPFGMLDEPVSLSPVSPDSALVRFFRGGANGRLDRVLALGRLSLPPRPQGARVVLEWEDGVPALVVRPLGSGAVVLVNIPLDPTLSNFTRRAVFLPLLHESLKAAAAPGRFKASFVFGRDTVTVRVPAGASSAELVSPDGSRRPLEFSPSSASLVVPFALEPGLYFVRFGGERETTAAFCVNYPPGESDLTRLDLSELAARLGNAKVLEDPTSFRHEAGGTLDLLPFLLPVLLALFVLEFYVANTFYRAAAPRPGEDRPGPQAGNTGGEDVTEALD